MRLIIQPDYQSVSQWAAHYVAAKIKAANPTPEKPFVLGCPTGSSPLGMYKALIDLNKKGIVSFQNVVLQHLIRLNFSCIQLLHLRKKYLQRE